MDLPCVVDFDLSDVSFPELQPLGASATLDFHLLEVELSLALRHHERTSPRSRIVMKGSEAVYKSPSGSSPDPKSQSVYQFQDSHLVQITSFFPIATRSRAGEKE